MRIHRLVGWMDGLRVDVVSPDITLRESEYDFSYCSGSSLRVTADNLFVELRILSVGSPWIVSFDLSDGYVVLLPWWYFEVVEELSDCA